MRPKHSFRKKRDYQIHKHKDEIISSVKDNVITLVSTPTGSGKSTQIPLYLLHLKRRIIVSEPRKIASVSISDYVRQCSKYAYIKEDKRNYYSYFDILFLTENSLISILSKDPDLSKGDVLFIDEVHERTINLELILYFMKYYTLHRSDFRLVIASATFNQQEIINYFSDFDSVYSIEQSTGLNYDIIYSDYDIELIQNMNKHKPITVNLKELFNEIRMIIDLYLQSNTVQSKTVLVFLPDYKSINFIHRRLIHEVGLDSCDIFELVGALDKIKQSEIVSCRTYKPLKIILSTTVAESSVTILNCDIVIDSGLKKVSKYNNQYQYFEETLEYISQDLAIQRSGRSGRDPQRRGTCFRIYSQAQYCNFRPFRIPDFHIKSIDVVLLKLFSAGIFNAQTLETIEDNGVLDFMSPVEKTVFDSSFNTLVEVKAIVRSDTGISVTDYGNWLARNELEPLLGKVLYHYCYDDSKCNKDVNTKKTTATREIIQLISLFSQSNPCDLFYLEIDQSEFQLGFSYQNQNTPNNALKAITDDGNIEKCIKNPIFQATKVNVINRLNDHDYVYWYLFTELDRYYNAKNIFTKTKLFQLGELMISLFFLRQYNCLKCHLHYNEETQLPHFVYHSSMSDQSHNSNCIKCNIVKEFYCRVYSMNPYFFSAQRKRLSNILKTIPNEYYHNNQLDTQMLEQEIANWNTIYIYLICKRPSPKQLLPYQLAMQLSQKIKDLDFSKMFHALYTSYQQFYQHFGGTLIVNLYNHLFHRVNFGGFNMYFGISDDYQRVKLCKTFFLSFFEFSTNHFFALTKINKTNSNEIYLKNINPIFPGMLSTFMPQYKYLEAEKRISKYSIHKVDNIGKYFFHNFLKPKFRSNLIEYSDNSLLFIFDDSYSCRNETKAEKIEEINLCIKREKEVFVSLTEDLVCLSKGCLILTLSQGLNVVNINTVQQNMIYVISLCKANTTLSLNQFEDLCHQHKINYSKIFQWNEQIMVSFQTANQSIFFIKAMSQYHEYIITSYQEQMHKPYNDYYVNNDYDIYGMEYDYSYPNWRIQNELAEMLNVTGNQIIITVQDNRKVVYCYLHNNTQGEYLLKNNGFIINTKHTFIIKEKTIYSSRFFYKDFNAFLKSHDILTRSLPIKHHYYQLLNYTPEKKQLIDQFISETEIQLNQFALFELQLKAKDTFLYQQRLDLIQYGKGHYCYINVIFFENKIILYGTPAHRNELKTVITTYFNKLMEERVLFSIAKEQQLSIRTLKKKAIRLCIALNVIEQNDELKIECRKQYITDIKKIIGETNLNSNTITLNNENNKNICEICLENLSSYKDHFNYLNLRLCGHSFCVECLKMQIANQINSPNSVPIKCVKCNEVISNSDIKEIFTQAEMEKLSYALIKVFIGSERGRRYKWCQNPNCNYIYLNTDNDKTNIRLCPNCNKRYCLICEGEVSDKTLHNQKCRKKLLKKVNYLDRVWMINHTKNCPVCNAIYEKMKGCNHITCVNCVPVTHFCYICGKVLNSDNPLRHYSDPQGKCYNLLYEEVQLKNNDDLDEIEEVVIDDNDDIPQKDEEKKKKRNKNDDSNKPNMIHLISNSIIEGNSNKDKESIDLFNDMENYLKFDNRYNESKRIVTPNNGNTVSDDYFAKRSNRNTTLISTLKKHKPSNKLGNHKITNESNETLDANVLDSYFVKNETTTKASNHSKRANTISKEKGMNKDCFKNSNIIEEKERTNKHLDQIDSSSESSSSSNHNSINLSSDSLSQYFI